MLRLKRAVVQRVTQALRPTAAAPLHAIRPRVSPAAALHTRLASHVAQICRLDGARTASPSLLGLAAPIVSPYGRWARISAQWSSLFTSAAREADADGDGKPIPLLANPDDPIQLPESTSDANETTTAASSDSAAESSEAPSSAPAPAATPVSAPSSSPSSATAAPHSTPPELKSAAPTPAEVAKIAAAEAAKARIHEEAENATFAPIPTAQPDAELKPLQKHAAADEDDPSASIPKLPSTDTMIRGTLWFDNMYPMRVHWLDMRYLVATHNHDTVIPKLFARAFGLNGFRLLGATPRANEGGVFVHFEVVRTAHVQTPEQVTKEIITLLRAKPVHAALTPKAVRCHLVRGTPFLDDMASRFPYNRLKIEVRGPDTALADLTIEQLYNELNQFGKIFDCSLGAFEKGKSRQGMVQYVRMFSAVGARNCLHRLKLSVPLAVGSLPAMVPPKVDEPGSGSSSSSSSSSKPQPPPTADAYLFLNYESILKTSYVTDFFVKHPRIMVPLLGLLFAAFTYLIFDPLRSWNITNFITRRLAWHELYARLPWPFGWIETQLSNFGNSSFFKQLKRGAGLGDSSAVPSTATSWSAREADEAQVRKWLNSKPDRLLFLTGPRGAGSLALIQKLTGDRKNVVRLDVSHIIDRADDEFVKAFAASVGFAPGFALLTWMSNIMDIFTPGASKASGSSTASSAQILKILECTSNALVNIAHKENAKRLKQQRQKIASLSPEDAAVEAMSMAQNPVPQIDVETAHRAATGASPAAGAMDSSDAKKNAEEQAKAPQEAQKTSQTATTTTIGSLLKMTGGMLPSMPGAPASAPDTPAPSQPAAAAAAAAASSTPPTNNTFEPLSHVPVVSGSPKHLSPDTSPVRLSEPPVSLLSYNESDTTEQQRNYQQFQATQHANGGKKSMAEAKEGLAEPEPDSLPLFIIDGFNVENSSKHSNFLNVLASWSAEMSAAGVARFVFLSDAALEESVTKALPDVKVAEVVLSDASPEAAQQFLFSSLPPNMRRAIPDQQTIAALKILGGRYNDLMQLVRGVENGTHPIETVEEIVVQSMNTVKGMLFTEDKNVKWSKVQMWQVLSMVVASPNGTVLYDDLLFNIFSGDDTPLKALVRNDLLRVEPALSRGGDRVRAGSPVFLEAFKRLVHHQSKLKPGMDLLVAKYQIGVEQAKINAIEEELMRIAQTTEEVMGESMGAQMMAGGGGGWGRRGGRMEKGGATSAANKSDMGRLLARQSFLVQLLDDSHTKIAGLDEKRRACEKEIKNIKKVDMD